MRNSRILGSALFLCVGVLLGSAFFAESPRAATQEKEATGKAENFFMLNALWFKEDGGAEKYAEYIAAATPFVAKHGGKAGDAYVPEAAMIGKFDADLVFFVEWPNDKAFTTFLADPGYQAISHLRGEAIADSLLIRCRKQ